MKTTILFRSDGSPEFEEEARIASEYFPVERQRSKVPQGECVIGRYSVLPFYRELEEDLFATGSWLINSHAQHQWIANFDWYESLREFTPRTWREHDFHMAPEGPYVVKGATNSRKYSWNTHMFAADKSAALEVASRLASDSMIGEQGLVYRQYVPLETFEVGINGLPFTNEWRCFFLGSKLVAAGYYWSSADDSIIQQNKTPPPDMLAFAKRAAFVACHHANFFVLDIARTESGEWILIEVNDGQMSGLSEIPPRELYRGLACE